MAKVLVTGASGFIGSHLAAVLAARGDDVSCLVRTTSAAEFLQTLGVRLVFGDVTDPESLPAAVAGQEVVYHVAGRTVALKKREFDKVNHWGVAHVAAACAARTTPPVLVCVSSLAAAGPAIDGRPRVESDPPAPVSNYGRSKRLGEQVVEALADRLPITIVRPPIVLGQRDHLGLPLFRSIVRFGVHFVPGRKPRQFSVIHATDLAQLLVLAAERGKRLPPPACEADENACLASCSGVGSYFAAGELAPTYAELGRLVAESVGCRLRVIRAGMLSVRVLSVLGEAISQARRQPMLPNLDKLREITAGAWLCSAAAAKDHLGFAVGAPLIERLRETAEWYRKEGWL
jgi:dihydroflavonol-4-reductase